jgi:hypothetical protein
MTATVLFAACVRAISRGILIRRESQKDKEFHFQNWIGDRLKETGLAFDAPGRNSYPDFLMVHPPPEGYEIKGLAYPGRDATFDSNSQVPTGLHNDRTIYYVFGRYPKQPDGDTYPVLDLVICHGDFLNAEHEYVHENKHVSGFGSYGDILIRDRKMYVVPTPFRLVEGAAHHRTLILPANIAPGEGFVLVGELCRVEAAEMIIGYSFDLTTNALNPQRVQNPGAGREHRFRAWRVQADSRDPVSLKVLDPQEIDRSPRDDDEE